jgi:cell division transport system permease protein
MSVHAYYLREAWRSFRRHPGPAWSVMLSLTATLALCGLFLLLAHNARTVLRLVGDRREIVVYLRDQVTAEQREAVTARLTDLYGTVEYVSPQAAWEEFSQQLGDPQLLQAVDQNPLPASLRVRLRPELLSYPATERAAAQIVEFPEVEDVRYGGEWVRRLDHLQATLLRGSLVAGLLVALAVVLILYSVFRLTVAARRREVELMLRLGASDGFVATPFVIEAVGETLAAALAALGLLLALEQLARHHVAQVTFLPPGWVAAFLGGAVLLAGAAAALALARTLRTAGP